MRNKLSDLNNHLFAQLERLGDEELKGEDLTEEISRAKAITNVAQQIVNNGNLVLNAIKTKEEYFPGQRSLPEFFPDTPDEGATVAVGKRSGQRAGGQQGNAGNNAAKTKRIPDNLKDGYD